MRISSVHDQSMHGLSRVMSRYMRTDIDNPIQKRHLIAYKCGVIYLTPSCLSPALDLTYQSAQSDQIVSPKPRSAGGCLSEKVLTSETCPGRQHRAQSPLPVEVHQSIFSPVLLASGEGQLRTALRVKGMSDLESRSLSV